MAIGRQDALAEAYDRHSPSVYGFAHRLCGSKQAEEVTHDVFVALWNSPEAYTTEEGSLRGALMAAAHVRAVDLMRADAIRRAQEAGMSALDRERKLLGPWHGGALESALSDLAGAEREAIVLAYFGGYSYKQVAALIQQPESAVRGDIAAGLRRIGATAARPSR